MLNANDKENLVKSSQTANLLVQDLRDLVKAANPLLAEIAMEILQQAIQIEPEILPPTSNRGDLAPRNPSGEVGRSGGMPAQYPRSGGAHLDDPGPRHVRGQPAADYLDLRQFGHGSAGRCGLGGR